MKKKITRSIDDSLRWDSLTEQEKQERIERYFFSLSDEQKKKIYIKSQTLKLKQLDTLTIDLDQQLEEINILRSQNASPDTIKQYKQDIIEQKNEIDEERKKILQNLRNMGNRGQKPSKINIFNIFQNYSDEQREMIFNEIWNSLPEKEQRNIMEGYSDELMKDINIYEEGSKRLKSGTYVKEYYIKDFKKDINETIKIDTIRKRLKSKKIKSKTFMIKPNEATHEDALKKAEKIFKNKYGENSIVSYHTEWRKFDDIKHLIVHYYLQDCSLNPTLEPILISIITNNIFTWWYYDGIEDWSETFKDQNRWLF